MIEFILFGGAVWFWILAVAFFVTLVSSEAAENGFYAFIGFIVLCGMLHWFGGTIDWNSIFNWYTVGMYLLIGFCFAWLRSYLYGRQQRGKIKKLKSYYEDAKTGSDHYKGTFESWCEKYDHAQNDLKEHVFRWWFNWPGSLVWWLLSDFFTSVWELTKRIFTMAYNAGLGS